MTPKEQRAADAQMLLEDQPVVVSRIVNVINELFSVDKNSQRNLRWLSSQLIEAEVKTRTTYSGTGSVHPEPLANYLRHLIKQEINDMVLVAVEKHVQSIDSRIRELHKLEKKGWFRP
jgi:hypothetical protein